jgi:hypothetical protein
MTSKEDCEKILQIKGEKVSSWLSFFLWDGFSTLVLQISLLYSRKPIGTFPQ